MDGLAPHTRTPDEGFLHDLDSLFTDAAGGQGDAAMLQRVLDASMRAVAGTRGFLALVDRETGDMEVGPISGPDWTDEKRLLRLSLAHEAKRGITGNVAVTGEPHLTGDAPSDPLYIPYFADVRSEIAVPIMGTSGHSWGVINIESERADAFGRGDLARLRVLAHAAATALRVQGFRSRESALVEIGNDLTTTFNTDDLMRRVVSVAADVLRFEDCSVFLIDEITRRLVLRASQGALAGEVGQADYAVGEGLTGWVAQTGEALRVCEPYRDARWRGRHTEFPDHEIAALLAVPIVSRGGILGVIRVLRRKGRRAWVSNDFSEAEQRVLSTIASQVGAAVENARSHQRLMQSERMAAWGELSARSAHMIGNRTFALKGDLNEGGYLVEQMPPGPLREEMGGLFRSMSRGVTRLEEILREFRDFVMATQLTRAQVDVRELLLETLEESWPKRSGVTLTTDIPEGLPAIACDAPKLKRAISELLENAVSFQPSGGSVTVAARRVAHDETQERRLPPGRDYVQIEVADSGPGVPAEAKERIFQPFYTSRAKGMGLGLSIVKGIVESHEGLIREAGTSGAGARFLLFLPASDR